jgi:hypothetical protein
MSTVDDSRASGPEAHLLAYTSWLKRDLLQCQKRPTTVSKETYYSVKRDLLVCCVHFRARLLPARVPLDVPTSMRRSRLPSVHRTKKREFKKKIWKQYCTDVDHRRCTAQECVTMAMAAGGEKKLKTHTKTKTKKDYNFLVYTATASPWNGSQWPTERQNT